MGSCNLLLSTFLVLCLFYLIFPTYCFNGKLTYRVFKSDRKEEQKYKYKVKYITVPVDHFNFVNEDVFKIKYLVNDEYWSPESGAPIFFYTGNEGDIELFADNAGFMWETAPEFKALLIFAEHRYYGESLPYGNNSFKDPDHWGYLTAEQALADFVDLITYLRSHQTERRSPVIAFGGSYGGMLSAWIRMKYPAAVAGSLASSAPVLQLPGLVDCNAFSRIVTSAYKVSAHHCPDNVRQTWKEITKFSKDEEGRKWLSTNWNLCKPIKTTEDGTVLKGWLSDTYVNVGMANYPYAANFLGELPAHPVKEFCKHVSAENLQGKKLLNHMYEGLKVWFNHTKTAKCLDYSRAGPATLGLQGWDYQACTEMVLPVCFDGINDMFEPAPFDLKQYMNACNATKNRFPKPYFLERQYGGKHIEAASNIIFSNGLLDPWSGGGFLRNVSKSVVAVLIPEGAHHLDLREANEKDPLSVIKARKFYKSLFRKWIREFHKRHSEISEFHAFQDE